MKSKKCEMREEEEEAKKNLHRKHEMKFFFLLSVHLRLPSITL